MSNIIGRAAEELLKQEEENLNNTIVVTTDIISISTGLVHYTISNSTYETARQTNIYISNITIKCDSITKFP